MSRAADTAGALADRIEMVARSLLGDPSSLTRHELRWGARGSLVLRLDGNLRGKWFDHERSEGGDLLHLVAREREVSIAEAIRIAERDYLGGAPPHPRPSRPASVQVVDAPPLTSMDVHKFLATHFPMRELMLTPWLPCKGLALVHAPRGLGKTHLAVGVAYAVSSGSGFLRWTAAKARRALLIDGEMPAVALQERLRSVAEASSEQPQDDYLRIVAADIQDMGLPDLARPDAQKFYEPLIGDRDLVIVDNLSTICPGMKENEADSWVPVQNWALSLRRAGKSALFIHHGGKSGAQRGTSRKEDVMDTVIGLRRPPDYSAEEGARFEVHFEKNRGFHGPDAESFEARLIGNQWALSEIKSGDDVSTLHALRKRGLSIRDISDRTGIPRSTVSRRLGGGDE